MNGIWKIDKLLSDDFEPLFNIMELNWFQRKLLNHMTKLQVIIF